METTASKTILSALTSTFVERPVTLTVDIAPVSRLHAFLQSRRLAASKKQFHIRPIRLGSLAKISEILLSIEDATFDPVNLLASNYEAMKKHHHDIARIIAMAIVNREEDPPESLVKCIINNFSSKDIIRCLDVVLKQMNVSDFMNSIISVRGMTVLKMSPEDQRRNIASGAQHKELSNISDSPSSMSSGE